MHLFSFPRLVLITATSVGLAACGGNAPTLTVPVSAPNAYLLTTDDSIVGVDLDSMEFARSVRGIPRATTASTTPNPQALEPNEVIQDIDYRNSEGALYALTKDGTKGRIIRIEPSSGAILRVSTLVSEINGSPIALSSTSSYTIDFNPVVDRLRVIGSEGANLRVDVNTGDTISDGNIETGHTITAAAYEDSFSSSGRTTQLLTLDSIADSVNLQDPPNSGSQSPLKMLLGTTNVERIDGYDINPSNNAGLAILSVGGTQQLFNINPSAAGNAASLLAAPPRLTSGIKYKALTFITTANPTVLALTKDNRFSSFNANTPNQVSNPVTISGLTAPEKVIGIDFSQSARKLYALTDTSNVYTINLNPPAVSGNPDAGAATLVSTLNQKLKTPNITYTMDFNPFVGTAPNPNLLRLIGSNNDNAEVTVQDGTVILNKAISGAATPLVKAAAYVNNFRGTSPTRLLVIDQASNSLSMQDISTDMARQGSLTRLAALGITLDPSSPVGFDISGRNNENQLLMARTTPNSNFSLYRVNSAVTSNPLTLVGAIASSSDFIDIAIRF